MPDDETSRIVRMIAARLERVQSEDDLAEWLGIQRVGPSEIMLEMNDGRLYRLSLEYLTTVYEV